MRKSGLAFHVHHDTLHEFCFDYDERVEFIKSSKPTGEQELRLRLFQLIPVDKLPKDGLAACTKAGKAFDKKKKTFDKADEIYLGMEESFNKPIKAFNKAWEDQKKKRKAYSEAVLAFIKAAEAYEKTNQQAIERLHNELCPDCPWDGKSIFNEGGN